MSTTLRDADEVEQLGQLLIALTQITQDRKNVEGADSVRVVLTRCNLTGHVISDIPMAIDHKELFDILERRHLALTLKLANKGINIRLSEVSP